MASDKDYVINRSTLANQNIAASVYCDAPSLILMTNYFENELRSLQDIDKHDIICDWRKTLPSYPVGRLPTPASSNESRQHHGTSLNRKREPPPEPQTRPSQRLKPNKCMDGTEGSQWDTEGQADQSQPPGGGSRIRGRAVQGRRITKRASGSTSPKKRGPVSDLDNERLQQLWEDRNFESASAFELTQSDITTSSRSRSPVKSVLNLRTAKPSTTFISTVPGVQCPEPVTQLRRLLTKGTYHNESVIPQGLEVIIGVSQHSAKKSKKR